MSDLNSSAIRGYRVVTFALALFFAIYMFTETSWQHFGLHFRFLTIWGLYAYFIVSWLMLRRSLGKSVRDWNPFVSATVVLSIIVVFMYWKLYFIDPSLVNTGTPKWFLEYYLHALGPLLVTIDALFFLGAFRRMLATFGVVMAMFLGYIAWIEIVIRPMNSTPVGSKESGLPYPFLNNMDMGERMGFYATTIGTALAILVACWLVSLVIARIKRPA